MPIVTCFWYFFSKTLCDPLPEVRKAAAKTFDSLHTSVGVRALDDILPFMLQQLVGTLVFEHYQLSSNDEYDNPRKIPSILIILILSFLNFFYKKKF